MSVLAHAVLARLLDHAGLRRERAGGVPGAPEGGLGALAGPRGVEAQDRRRERPLERRPDRPPRVARRQGVELGEGREGRAEVVPGLVLGVGLDVHEDGEPVERRGDGLRGRAAGEVLRGNEALDGVRVLSGCAEEGLEAVAQRVRGRVLVRDPVGGLGHVGGRDGEDVQEALRAPPREPLPEAVERGGRVQAQDGVRHVELVLHPGQVVGQQVEGGEVPVVVRERAGQLVGLLLRGGGGVGLADGRVELEELADPGGRGIVEPPARLGQVREPLEAPSAGRGRVGEGLGVRDGLVPLVAGLLEQLGELPQDLEVLLREEVLACVGWHARAVSVSLCADVHVCAGLPRARWGRRRARSGSGAGPWRGRPAPTGGSPWGRAGPARAGKS